MAGNGKGGGVSTRMDVGLVGAKLEAADAPRKPFTFRGLTIQPSERCCRWAVRGRSWRERLFTRPWRPWRKVESYMIPLMWKLRLPGQRVVIVAHPQLITQIRGIIDAKPV